MRYLLLLLLLPFTANDNKKPSQMTDLESDGLNGSIKTTIQQGANAATYRNGEWIITDSNAIVNITEYNTKGFATESKDMLKADLLRTRYYWAEQGKDDTTYFYELEVERGKEEHDMMVGHWLNDSVYINQYFYADNDTFKTKHLDDIVTTYTATGSSTVYYTIENRKQVYSSHSIHLNIHKDTTRSTYYSEDTTFITTVILERDSQGNPTKRLNCRETDTSISLTKYIYY